MGEAYLCPPRKSTKNDSVSSKQGTKPYSTCWHKHEPDKRYNDESHIHVVPGITARTYTIISEYMRYKYNPNAPIHGEGLTKSDWYMQIIKVLQVAKVVIIKYLELHRRLWWRGHPGMWGATYRATPSWGLKHLTHTRESSVASAASLNHQAYESQSC